MYPETYRVSIEAVENGFVVELPDMAKRAERQKKAKAKGGTDAVPYMGDCTEKYTAKSILEVVKLVKSALEKIPEGEFDKAFNEAASK